MAAIFDWNYFNYALQVIPMFLTVSSWLAFWFRKRSKKIDFQYGRHTILAIFDLQVTPMLLTKSQVSWHLIYKSPRCFLPSLKSAGIWVQEWKRKIDFQDRHHGSHLGFRIGMILAIFDLQVLPPPPPPCPPPPRCFLTSFKSVDLWIQEKKLNIDL